MKAQGVSKKKKRKQHHPITPARNTKLYPSYTHKGKIPFHFNEKRCKIQNILIDSGASVHITNNLDFLQQVNEVTTTISGVSGRNKMLVLRGTMQIIILESFYKDKIFLLGLKDVYYIPSCEHTILSEAKFLLQLEAIKISRGDYSVFYDALLMKPLSHRLFHRDGLVFWKIGVIIKQYSQCSKHESYLQSYSATIANNKKIFSRKRLQQLEDYHRLLCHPGYSTMKALSSYKLLNGLHISSTLFENNSFGCMSCELANKNVQKGPSKPHEERNATYSGRCIAIDLIGPLVRSYSGYYYILMTVDQKYNYKIASYLKAKNNACEALIDIISKYEAICNERIMFILNDNGGEFTDQNILTSVIKNAPYRQIFTCPYSSFLNGSAERSNRTIIERLRSTLEDTKLPVYLWEFMLATICELVNKTTIVTIDERTTTAYEAEHGKKADFSIESKYGPIGGLLIYNDNKLKSKLQNRGRVGVLLGYFLESIQDIHIGPIIYDPLSHTIVRTKSVTTVPNFYYYSLFEYDDSGKQSWQHDIGSLDSLLAKASNLSNKILRDFFDPSVQLKDSSAKDESELSNDQSYIDISDSDNGNLSHDEMLNKRKLRSSEPNPKKLKIPRTYFAEKFHGLFLVDTISDCNPKNITQCLSQNSETKSSNKDEIIQSLQQISTSNEIDQYCLAILTELDLVVETGCVCLSSNNQVSKDVEILPTKFVFTFKDKLKARLVARGDRQNFGYSYFNVFLNTASHFALKVFLSCCSKRSYRMFKTDISRAFLNARLQKVEENKVEINFPNFLSIISNIHNKELKKRLKYYNKNNHAKVLKSLYGLRSAPGNWAKELERFLVSIKFHFCHKEKALFTRITGNNTIILLVYVDDILIGSNSLSEISLFESELSKRFEHKPFESFEEPRTFLGINIQQIGPRILYHQYDYIEKLMSKFSVTTNEKIRSPISTTLALPPDLYSCTEETLRKYQSIIGSLLYCAILSRPDILYATITLSRVRNPTSEIFHAAKRILQYLWNTREYTNVIGGREISHPANTITIYSDASHGGSNAQFKGMNGLLIYFEDSLIVAKSKTQKRVTLSSTDAELDAATNAVKMLKYITNLISFLGPTVEDCHLRMDSKSGIMVLNNYSLKLSKMSSIQFHFIQEMIELGELSIDHIRGSDNPADILTKALPADQVCYIAGKLFLKQKNQTTMNVTFTKSIITGSWLGQHIKNSYYNDDLTATSQ